MQVKTFKDIDVIDIEEGMKFQALHEPSYHYFHLKLPAMPPPWWMAHFMELYGAPTVVRQGQMYLAGRYVMVLSDFERAFTYVQRTRKAVARTNKDYRGFMAVLRDGGEPVPGAAEVVAENMMVLPGRLFGKGKFAPMQKNPNW